MASKKKVPIAKQRKRLEKKLDTLWSEVVKLQAHNKCELCGADSTLNSHHIFSRGRKNTRWNLNNGVALCVIHHMWKGAHSTNFEDQERFHKWLNEYRGKDNLEQLRTDSHVAVKNTLQDLQCIEVALKFEKEKYLL